MPFYGRVTEAGIGGPKAGAHQGAWAKPEPHHLQKNGGGQVLRVTRPQESMKKLTGPPDDAQAGASFEAQDGMTMDIHVDVSGTSAGDTLTLNGAGNGAGNGAQATEGEIAEAEACAWTVSEAEAHLLQMEMDEEARNRRRWWELLLAAGAGFAVAKMIKF